MKTVQLPDGCFDWFMLQDVIGTSSLYTLMGMAIIETTIEDKMETLINQLSSKNENDVMLAVDLIKDQYAYWTNQILARAIGKMLESGDWSFYYKYDGAGNIRPGTGKANYTIPDAKYYLSYKK